MGEASNRAGFRRTARVHADAWYGAYKAVEWAHSQTDRVMSFAWRKYVTAEKEKVRRG